MNMQTSGAIGVGMGCAIGVITNLIDRAIMIDPHATAGFGLFLCGVAAFIATIVAFNGATKR